jgi:hypothetical protein
MIRFTPSRLVWCQNWRNDIVRDRDRSQIASLCAPTCKEQFRHLISENCRSSERRISSSMPVVERTRAEGDYGTELVRINP